MSLFKICFSKNNNIKIVKEKQNLTFAKEEYDELYDTAKLVCRMIGLRLTRNDPPLAKLLWDALYWFLYLNLFFSLLLELTNVVQTASDGTFIDLLVMMPCIGYLVLGMAKSYKIVYYRPVYENLISELRDMWPEGTVSEEEYNIVRSSHGVTKNIIKGYFYCNSALVLFFVAPPFIITFRRMMGEDVPMMFSFSYYIPFDPYKFGRFEAIYILQTFHCYLSVAFMVIGDILFCVFLSQITTQFSLLAYRIKKLFYVPIDDQLIEAYPLVLALESEGIYLCFNVGTFNASFLASFPGHNSTDLFSFDSAKYCKEHHNADLESTIGSIERENMYQKNLKEIIKRHRDLIRLSGDVEEQFSFALLINFVNSSIIICFCGYCCVFVEDWKEINYKIFLTTAIVQIWLLCWYGQKLLDSNPGILDAVYSSGWYNVPQNIKSSLIIIVYRSQKEVFVTTYGFSIICLESYSKILQTSWSYLMILVNFFEQ